MSKGMCCSASQWICSSSSAAVMMGTVILRMMTLCPETLSATSFCLMRASWKTRCSTSTTFPASITCPSTMVCGGRGANPNRTSEGARRTSRI